MGRRKKSEVMETDLLVEEVPSKPKIDRSKLKAPINTWVPKESDMYVTYEMKQCTIHFGKIFGIPKLDMYKNFIIAKDSYSNQLPLITRYINFFISNYDTEKELLIAYLNIKCAESNEDADIYFTGEDQFDNFISYVYDVLFTPSIVDKINRLVEENYLDDIEIGDGGKKYVTKEKKHLESLEFTNEHIKAFLKISFGIKLLTPVVFHYFHRNKIIVNKTTSHLFKAFRQLFIIFGDTCNMYNKLFVYVNV